MPYLAAKTSRRTKALPVDHLKGDDEQCRGSGKAGYKRIVSSECYLPLETVDAIRKVQHSKKASAVTHKTKEE
jgi:hypothetical protein